MDQENTKQLSVPGERALQAMKNVKEGVFKMPLVPVTKTREKSTTISQIVLAEDNYIEELGKIIQRDFFPDLEKLRAQNEYLEAVDRNDIPKLRALYAKYSSDARPPPTERYASPATFETPIDIRRGSETPHVSETPEREPLVVQSSTDDDTGPKMGLDQYLAKHTSEDNQSFQDIMINSEMKQKQKYWWLYEAEEKHKAEREKQLALPSIEEQAKGQGERPLNVDNWEYKNKNYIMYIPEGVELTQEERVEMAKSRQEVVHSNTRMNRCPFDEQQSKAQIAELAQSQARAQDGRIGVDGLVQTSGETGPMVRGFSFVKTPSPAPGVCESPLMTWGEIEGTPFRLDGSDTPLRSTAGPSFRMAQPPKREKIALALAEKAGQRHRDLKQKAINAARQHLATPSPSRASLSAMSPAAQRLASTSLRRKPTDSALRASYTPGRTPHSSRAGTPLSRSATPLVRTPSRPRQDPLTITDDLLNLPKRPRAADFF